MSCFERGHRFHVFRSRHHCPSKDVQPLGEDRPKRRLDVSVPQDLASQTAAHRAAKESRKRRPPERKVEPHQQICLLGEDRPSTVVLPFRDPRVLGDKCTNVVDEFRPRRPVRTVEQSIDFGVGDSGQRGDPSRESRFTRPRDPRHHNAFGVNDQGSSHESTEARYQADARVICFGTLDGRIGTLDGRFPHARRSVRHARRSVAPECRGADNHDRARAAALLLQ